MGWTKGMGLGKNATGITKHIVVTKREENVGLGVEKERATEREGKELWWRDNVCDTLSRLQNLKKLKKDKENKKKKKKSKKKRKKEDNELDNNHENDGEVAEKSKKKKRKKEKKSSTTTTTTNSDDNYMDLDEQLFKATGGARFGMRAQRRATGKWNRSEHSQEMKEWEKSVKNTSAEWNGLGKAQVVLNVNKIDSNGDGDRSSSKRKRSRSFDGEEKKQEEDENVHESSEKSIHSKEKKVDTKPTFQAITSPSKDNETIISEATTPKEKKKKKDKKSKRSKKSKRQ